MLCPLGFEGFRLGIMGPCAREPEMESSDDRATWRSCGCCTRAASTRMTATTIAAPRCTSRPPVQNRKLRWFSRCGPFTRIGHIAGGGRPLLREGGPISYEARPFEFELRGDRPLAVGLHLYGEGLFVTTNQSLITKAPPRTGFRSRRVGLAY